MEVLKLFALERRFWWASGLERSLLLEFAATPKSYRMSIVTIIMSGYLVLTMLQVLTTTIHCTCVSAHLAPTQSRGRTYLARHVIGSRAQYSNTDKLSFKLYRSPYANPKHPG